MDHDSSLRDRFLNCASQKILSVDNDFLEDKIKRDEVKWALAEAETGKSPGLDGIPVEVYQVIESDIGELLMEMMNETIDTGSP